MQRIHPAQSRVHLLAQQTPARILLFDLLAVDGELLTGAVLATRRKTLETFAQAYLKGRKRIGLSPVTRTVAVARRWLRQGVKGGGGVVAKRDDMPYQSGNRSGMQKIKIYVPLIVWCVVFGTAKEKKRSGPYCLVFMMGKACLIMWVLHRP